MPSDTSRDRAQSGTGAGGAPSGRLPHWLRDPLVVFVLLGIGVFALDGWLAGSEAARPVIEITPDEVDRLRARWIAQWGREPTEPELQTLVAEAIDEEILCREAQRLGLDRDDAIVRRRLAQKLTFILEDAGNTGPPSEAELEEYYAGHAERLELPRILAQVRAFAAAGVVSVWSSPDAPAAARNSMVMPFFLLAVAPARAGALRCGL
jgi:peptidyl-prolyl cis-trans isomerase C